MPVALFGEEEVNTRRSVAIQGTRAYLSSWAGRGLKKKKKFQMTKNGQDVIRIGIWTYFLLSTD